MLMRSNSLDMRPITSKDYVAVLEVYRQCEDFLSLGPEPKASLAMVRKDIDIRNPSVRCRAWARTRFSRIDAIQPQA
jgi:hypothetical protein